MAEVPPQATSDQMLPSTAHPTTDPHRPRPGHHRGPADLRSFPVRCQRRMRRTIDSLASDHNDIEQPFQPGEATGVASDEGDRARCRGRGDLQVHPPGYPAGRAQRFTDQPGRGDHAATDPRAGRPVRRSRRRPRVPAATAKCRRGASDGIALAARLPSSAAPVDPPGAGSDPRPACHCG